MSKSTKKTTSYPRYADKQHKKSKGSPFNIKAPLDVINCKIAGSNLASSGKSKKRKKGSNASVSGALLGSYSCKKQHRKKK